MPDDSHDPERHSGVAAEGSAISPPAARRGFLRRHWGKLTLAAVVAIPATVFAVWSAVTLGFSYSSGERVGFVQKLSHKGWLCKTWEGELQMVAIPGSTPIIFSFTVWSDSLARVIQESEGKKVSLQYEQHRGVPTSCFGETEYFVVGTRVLGS